MSACEPSFAQHTALDASEAELVKDATDLDYSDLALIIDALKIALSLQDVIEASSTLAGNLNGTCLLSVVGHQQ